MVNSQSPLEVLEAGVTRKPELVRMRASLLLPHAGSVVPVPDNLLLLLEHLDTVSPVMGRQIRVCTDSPGPGEAMVGPLKS